MDRNKLEIIAGEAHAMVGDGKVILNGVELIGVRSLSFEVLPDDILSALITIRVDDVSVDGAAIKVIENAKV